MIAELLLLIALSSGSEDEDRLISAQIMAGDKKAFHKFYDKHQSYLFSFLTSKGLNDQEAEDLIQQAFLIIWEKRAKIDPGRSLRSYLFTTAYNRMLNHFRDHKKTEPSYAYEINDGKQNPEELAITKEAIKRMHSALTKMPEKRRSVYELCYLKEFTYKEAADAMAVSPRTIENHMALALRDLREALKNYT